MSPNPIVRFKNRLVSNTKESVGLVPIILRKPRVFRHWLLYSYKAQVFLLLTVLLLPYLIIPTADYVLAKIFSPVTEEVLFGLINTEKENPYLNAAILITNGALWTFAILLAVYVYLRQIPAAIDHARDVVLNKVSEAEKLIAAKPSESILLYNSARDWTVDEQSETDIMAKMDSVNQTAPHETTRTVVSPTATVVAEPPQSNDPTATAVSAAKPQKQGPIIIAERYQLKKKLGSGAMGTVYLAEDTRLKRDIALKQLSPNLSQDEHILARFRQEALALARLSHPNVVQVYDFTEGEGFFWIAMELVVGEELEDKINASGKLAPAELKQYAVQMAKALDYAHQQGVIHRDFKPANVLISKAGEAKITDFGIAKLAQSSILTQMNTVMGSPAYMSPEQASGDEVDARTDIYAMGVVLYQMASGELPFKGDTKSVIAQHLTKEPPSLHARFDSIPQGLDLIIQKMMAKSPDNRYQSMAELIEQLEAL